jgi:para-nitrobenzyl esterase
VFACNGFDSNRDLSKRVPVFAYEFDDPNAPSAAGVPGPGSNGSGFTTASQHAAELQYIFNFGSAFTAAQAQLATDMKTYWANFVKTGNPNGDEGPPFWPRLADHEQTQLLAPQGPAPFDTFTTEHFCGTWEPLLTFNKGNEPQQP